MVLRFSFNMNPVYPQNCSLMELLMLLLSGVYATRSTMLFYVTVLVFATESLQSMASIPPSNETDRLGLLAFKNQISNDEALSSWNDTLHFCHWDGITCSRSGQRVTALRMQSKGLSGSLTPYLANLTSLQELNLGDNRLHGEIPPQLGSLIALRLLNLTTNTFRGQIPANLSRCRELISLDLGRNQLVGEIPNQLVTSLLKLTDLLLLTNNLTGTIPPSIGNLSSLVKLAMGRNRLVGSIPDGIGLLARLEFLQIAENQLSGLIPRSLYNLSNLNFIAIADNQLQGRLPTNLGVALPKLQTLYVGGNQIAGPIPPSILNASGFINLDLAYNNFTGSVPADIGRLSGLVWLNFEGNNQLGVGDDNGLDFITSLGNCSNLETLDIDSNAFQGVLPGSIANLSTHLSMLIMSGNKISGSIPHGISNLVGLTLLRMEKNLLTGTIPVPIGRLTNLQTLSFFRNKLSGHIPSSLGNLTQLNELRLRENILQGSIPPSLGNCTIMQLLDLSQNMLQNSIPPEVIAISSLSILLSLAHNSLVGSLPAEVGNLVNLGQLDVSENRLSGEIPQALGKCNSMEYLHMGGNMLQGAIPSSLIMLKGVQFINLSHNNLSGPIPDYLGKLLSLTYLNLSNNNLEGVVPEEGVFTNASGVSVEGNDKLCGGVPLLQLPSCNIQTPKETENNVIIIVCVVSSLVLLSFLLAALYLKCCSAKKTPSNTSSLEEPTTMKISYRELFKATDGFSSTNLIGQGSYGTVYRGAMDDNGTIVAVKVLDLQHRGASKSFMAECHALGQVRHRNLIKILTSCSSVDSNGNDFKALVYEFMPNGNLDEWLHQNSGDQYYSKFLNIFQRLSISIDVASALDYLHHQCQVPIVHCDLKPSNVLLDNDMTAHVSDFGLAKILQNGETSQIHSSSIAIKGSIGYVPPEYGMGSEASTQGDIYSYGILLLEMFTGKRPTDDTLNQGSGLHNVVKSAYPEQVMEIVDRRLLQGKTSMGICEHGEDITGRIQECLISVIGIGLSCSATLPRERMETRDVVIQMHDIRAKFVKEEEIQTKKGTNFISVAETEEG